MVTYPIGTGSLFDQLDLLNVQFGLARYEVGHILQSGQMFGARRGKPRWKLSGTLRPDRFDEAVRLETLIGRLQGMVGTFYAYDPRKPYPKDDPTGANWALSPAPAILDFSSTGVRFTGVKNWYNFSVGDYFSINSGLGLWSLHRVTENVQANGSGNTTWIEVEPLIRTGVTIGDTVNFVKPAVPFKLMPSGVNFPVGSGNWSEGIQFEALQEL